MSQTLGGEYVRGWFPVRHWLTLWGGLGRRCQGDIAAWGLQTAQDRQGRNCANVCACLFSPISMYHLKTIIASRRHWADGIVWILYSGGHSGRFFLQSQKMFLSMDGFVGRSLNIWLALLQHPVVKYGQRTLNLRVLSLSHSAPRWQRVFLSFCPLFKLLQMTADNRIKAVPVRAYFSIILSRA